MLFKRFVRSIYRNLTELCSTPASAVLFSPALDVIRAQLQRLQQTGKIRTLSTAVRAIQTHSHEFWSKILNLNLDLNGVSETDITLAILKNKQTNKPLKITFEQNTNNCNLTVKQCDTIRLLLTELTAKTELQL